MRTNLCFSYGTDSLPNVVSVKRVDGYASYEQHNEQQKNLEQELLNFFKLKLHFYPLVLEG